MTERFPDYWPGQFEYADQLYHSGPLLGHDLRKAALAFLQALQLNPRLVPAVEHLSNAAMLLEDTALITRTMRQRDSLVPLDPTTPSGTRAYRLVQRMQLALVSGKPFDGPLADTLVRYAASFENLQDQAGSAAWFSRLAHPAAQIVFSRRVLARSTVPSVAAFQRKGIALAWAARGAWDSALAAMDEYANRASDLAGLTDAQIAGTGASPELAQLDPYRIAVVGAWLGGLDPGLAAARRESAVRAMARLSGGNMAVTNVGTAPGPSRQALLLWLDAILASSQGDLAKLRHARRRLEEDTTSTTALLRSVKAFELELLGRRREASDSIAALSWEYWNWAEPYFIGINRLAAARWLVAERDSDQAARLLSWHQATIYPHDFTHAIVVLDGLSHLELARIEAARGDSTLARHHYQRFLQRYDAPSPKMRHLVEEALAALRRLE